MVCKYFFNLIIPSRFHKAGLFILFIFLVYLAPANSLLNAQNINQKLRVTYNNNYLSISAIDVDLKNVLLELADKTDIYVGFPNSLKKKITIETNRISIEEALRKLLKGLNYAILYYGSSGNEVTISKVFVFKKYKKDRRVRSNESRLAKRIRAYERQIKSLKRRLLKVDADSGRGKRYLRQVRRLENNIKKLERQLE
jgi:hypothetical protein